MTQSGIQKLRDGAVTDRETAITNFLGATQWSNAQRVTVAGDASNRRYDRLTHVDGTAAILMDASPEKGEDPTSLSWTGMRTVAAYSAHHA